MTMPGKIVILERDGTPAGSMLIRGDDPTAGGFHVLDQMKCRAGYLAVVGRSPTQSGAALLRTRFLALLDWNGRERVRVLEETTPDPITAGKYMERDDYFVNLGRWALGPDGTIYAAPERDRYLIHVYAPGGGLKRVIERDFRRWKRTPEEKRRVGEGMMGIVNGQRATLEIEADDYAPCVTQLHAAESGELWVPSSRGTRKQPPGVLATYDVFDAEGHLVREVAIACDGCDRDADRIFFLGADRMALVKNCRGSVRSMTGSGTRQEGKDGGEPGVVEVVCYAVTRD